MSYVSVGIENCDTIDVYFEDHGTGTPVVLIHGWPLTSRSWERQVPALLKAGFRVITYDRRGFGESSRPTCGYDYDTFADDLHQLLSRLDIRDAVLVGFSMGGGEVARYLGRHGSDRVAKAVFVDAVPPFLLKTIDNPEGVDTTVFDAIKSGLLADRFAFLAAVLADFYNVDLLTGTHVSDQAVQFTLNEAAASSPIGMLECLTAFTTTDFRNDLARIDIPVLVIHGDEDRIVPLCVSGLRTHRAVPRSRLIVIKGAPHFLGWTHADDLNRALIDFLTDTHCPSAVVPPGQAPRRSSRVDETRGTAAFVHRTYRQHAGSTIF